MPEIRRLSDQLVIVCKDMPNLEEARTSNKLYIMLDGIKIVIIL